MSSITRVTFECPTWSQYIAAAGTDVDAVLNGVETPNLKVLDMGTVAQSANSDAMSLAVEFDLDFDDTVFDDLKVWMLNLPDLDEHVWAVEFEQNATQPDTLDDVLAGPTAQTITGNPWDANVIKGAVATEYDGTGKKISTIILQLQVGAAGEIWDQSLSEYECPRLVIEIPRRDADVTYLSNKWDGLTSEQQGHMHVYSAVKLFIEDATTQEWRLFGSIKENELNFNPSNEYASYSRGRPETVILEAVSNVVAEADFTVYNCDPAMMARAFQTNAVIDTDRGVVSMEIGGNPCQPGVLESNFIIQWRTYGGHLARVRMNRATLKTSGAFTPGSDDFAGQAFMLTAKAEGDALVLAEMTWTRVPTEVIVLPIIYKTTV